MTSSKRKIRIGQVVSDKMSNTVVVAVEWRQAHRKYAKPMKRITKFKAHDAENACRIGDTVKIEETRPISRHKRWRVAEILNSREIAELQPTEIDQTLLEEQATVHKRVEEVADETPQDPELEAPISETESYVEDHTGKDVTRVEEADEEPALAEETPIEGQDSQEAPSEEAQTEAAATTEEAPSDAEEPAEKTEEEEQR